MSVQILTASELACIALTADPSEVSLEDLAALSRANVAAYAARYPGEGRVHPSTAGDIRRWSRYCSVDPLDACEHAWKLLYHANPKTPEDKATALRMARAVLAYAEGRGLTGKQVDALRYQIQVTR
jgi:hypothetical protein